MDIWWYNKIHKLFQEYYNRDSKYSIPVFNLVIKLSQGKVTGIVWDNDCFSCTGPDNVLCLNNTAIPVNKTDTLQYWDKVRYK